MSKTSVEQRVKQVETLGLLLLETLEGLASEIDSASNMSLQQADVLRRIIIEQRLREEGLK